MKKVLMLTYYFPPAPLAYSQRVGKLCKYMARETDWLPQVISAELPWDMLPGQDKVLLADIPDSVFIGRTANFLASSLALNLRARGLYKPVALMRKILFRSDAYADWIAQAEAAAESKFPQGEGISAIFASGPPNSVYLAAVRLSKAWNKPLVIDMRDPWSPLWGRRHPWANRFWSRETIKVEERIYQASSMIIVNTNGAAADLKQRFPKFASKIAIVPNGFDSEDLNWHSGPALRQADEPADTVHILNLGGIRDGSLEAVLLGALTEYLRENPGERRKIKVHFIGGAPEQIERMAKPFGLTDICKGYGLVPTNHVGRPLAEADIYILLQPEKHVRSIPSKLFSYLAGGGYIFALIPDLLAQEVRKNFVNFPEILEVANQETAKRALTRIIAKARTLNRPSNNIIPDYALRYDRRVIAQQVADILNKVVQ
jgi:hypothetical protein